MPPVASYWRRWNIWLLSAVAGAVLGCIFRLAFDSRYLVSNSGSFPLIMTIAFLMLVPLAMGYFSVERYLRATPADDVVWYQWFFLPWGSVLLAMAVCIVVGWEKSICLLIAGPIMLFFSLVGGIAARLAWRRLKYPASGTLSAVALPLLLLFVEVHIPLPNEIRTVHTSILIHAPTQVVWDNIKSVHAIAPSELPDSWVNRIGFPKPVAATLSQEGVGGVRQASFTGGLVFTETVNRWEPGSDLRFSIRANTDTIPRSTLDEHVTIGGAFFDVLDGEYRLEQRPDGVLLHLTSRERVSTHFNLYAEQWTDAVMRTIQRQILEVIRARCESAGTTLSTVSSPPSAEKLIP
jgi:hypothetical protein